MSRSDRSKFEALASACLVMVVIAGPVAAQHAYAVREGRGSIEEMRRLSTEKGWALTDRALLTTHDGGLTWLELASGSLFEGVSDAVFLSDSEVRLAGISQGSRGILVLVYTNDGGLSWQRKGIEASSLGPGRAYVHARLHFLDTRHGWLLGRIATSSAFSTARLLKTNDGGETWQPMPPPPGAGRFTFIDSQRGFMTGAPVCERLYRTVNGGMSWEEVDLSLTAKQGMALYDLPTFHSPMSGSLAVTLRGDSPRVLTFATGDGGDTWSVARSMPLPPGDYDEPVPFGLADRPQPDGIPIRSLRSVSPSKGGSAWGLVVEGGCDTGTCRQITRLVKLDGPGPSTDRDDDLLARTLEKPRIEKERQRATEKTAISVDFGFDKCAAGSGAQMQAWWDHSPYRDANIYFGGAARACSQIHLDAEWIADVFDQGWQLIPTWVGPQAPCTSYSRRISSNPAEARHDALAEADAAVAAVEALGLGQGTPLYYDVEYYDENDQACSAAMREFINAWTERLNQHGYLAGAYGNARNVNNDWIPGVIANPPDAVWLVPWVCGRTSSCDWTPSVFGVPGLDDSYWSGFRRIRQYWGPHTETYGGVTFEIDGDYANGPVAAATDSPSCWNVVLTDRWQGEYFDTADLGGRPAMIRDDGGTPLDFDWGSGSPGESCGIPSDDFSVRWTRTTNFEAGSYRFTVAGGDGYRLLIDGTLAIDEWSVQSPVSSSVVLVLPGGDHTVNLEYSAGSGVASVRLTWKRLANVQRSRPSSRVSPVVRVK